MNIYISYLHFHRPRLLHPSYITQILTNIMMLNIKTTYVRAMYCDCIILKTQIQLNQLNSVFPKMKKVGLQVKNVIHYPKII